MKSVIRGTYCHYFQRNEMIKNESEEYVMSNPERLEVSLSEYGYRMEIDLCKWDCSREEAHWHLCKNGRRIGQISAYGSWTSKPSDVSSAIIREAESLTARYSSEIIRVYNHNRENGAD